MSAVAQRPTTNPATRHLVRIVSALVLLVIVTGLSPTMAANAAGSPTGAVAQPWPSIWNDYRLANGDAIADNNTDQNPSILDLASGTCVGNCVGPESSVMYYSDGTTAFFRMRLATDIADLSKGGLVGGAFLVQIANASNNVLAVVGVDGKSSSSDDVYIANAPGTNVTPVYTFPFDTSGGETSTGMRVVSAADGSGQYFLDFQVPVSAITSVSGGAITTSTPIKFYYGSSAAANLATINKDFMLGAVTSVDFTGLSTVTLTPASLSLSSAAVSSSGPNPPRETATSTYAVTVTASNPGGGEITSSSVTVPIPAGVTASSLSTASGTFTGGGTSSLSWNIGTIPAGGSTTATFTVSVTPGASTAGSTLTLVSSQSAQGTDAPAAATRTATAPAITVGPVGTAPTWSVSFNSQGGTAVSSQTIASNGTATAPADPTRTGYTFDGWYTASSGGTLWDFASTPVTADTTLYARWTLADYTVTFNSEGGSPVASQNVLYGDFASAPADPTRAGYNFEGWFPTASGGTEFDFATTAIVSDVTVHAQWSALDYTVTFDSQGGSAVSSAIVPNGDPVLAPTAPTLPGFTFNGWFDAASGGTAWDFLADTVSADTTLYAQWNAIDYTMMFDSQGGSAVSGEVVEYGRLATEPADPSKYGYAFDGWYSAATGGTPWDFTSDTVVTATTLHAHWTPADYAVSFNSQGGSFVAGQSAAYGDVATEPSAPTRSGYTFDGWYTASSGGAVWDFTTDPVTGATVLYAQWTPVDYTVTFDAQGGTAVGAQTVANGSLVAQPTPPTQAGYTLDGWYTAASGGTLWDFGADAVSGNTTLYAQWVANTNTVTFDGQGGSFTPGETVATGSHVTQPSDPSRYGYAFDGWYTASSGGVLWDFTNDTVSGNTTLYAQWTAGNYAVTFNSQGGSSVAPQSVAYGDGAAEPSAPTRSGYTFDGWYTASSGGAAWNFAADPVTEATVLYAQWTPVDYTVTFMPQGGTAVGAQTVTNGSLVIQPTPPTHTGYAFDGWYTSSSGSTLWDFGADAVSGNTTLYAQWTAVPQTLTFDSRGGSVVASQTLGYNTVATEPTDPTRPGYTFDGWYTASSGGTLWNFATDALTTDVTLFAQWTAVDYALSFDPQGGSAVAGEAVAYGALAMEPADPTRTGYSFDGWFSEASGGYLWDFTADKMTGNRTLYAQWTPLEYAVVFDSQGGTAVGGPDGGIRARGIAAQRALPGRDTCSTAGSTRLQVGPHGTSPRTRSPAPPRCSRSGRSSPTP